MPKRKADEEDAEEEANAGSSIEQLTEDGILEKVRYVSRTMLVAFAW